MTKQENSHNPKDYLILYENHLNLIGVTGVSKLILPMTVHKESPIGILITWALNHPEEEPFVMSYTGLDEKDMQIIPEDWDQGPVLTKNGKVTTPKFIYLQDGTYFTDSNVIGYRKKEDYAWGSSTVWRDNVHTFYEHNIPEENRVHKSKSPSEDSVTITKKTEEEWNKEGISGSVARQLGILLEPDNSVKLLIAQFEAACGELHEDRDIYIAERVLEWYINKDTPSEVDNQPTCSHEWEYEGTDGHGSHKGEDLYTCKRCHERKYEF